MKLNAAARRLQRVLQDRRDAEQCAAEEDAFHFPAPEDDDGKRDETAASAHVLGESRSRELGACRANEQRLDDQRGPSQPRHRVAAGVHGLRILAARAQPQTESRAPQHQPKRDRNHDPRGGCDRARIHVWYDAGETIVPFAICESGHAEREEIDRCAGDDLIGAKTNREDAEEHRDEERAGKAAEESEQHRRHRGGEHHSFDAEVDHSRAFDHELAFDSEKQRYRRDYRQLDHDARLRMLPNRMSTRMTTACPRVATDDETFAARCNSPAPVTSAPKNAAATIVASGWSCASSATAIPEQP